MQTAFLLQVRLAVKGRQLETALIKEQVMNAGVARLHIEVDQCFYTAIKNLAEGTLCSTS